MWMAVWVGQHGWVNKETKTKKSCAGVKKEERKRGKQNGKKRKKEESGA